MGQKKLGTYCQFCSSGKPLSCKRDSQELGPYCQLCSPCQRISCKRGSQENSLGSTCNRTNFLNLRKRPSKMKNIRGTQETADLAKKAGKAEVVVDAAFEKLKVTIS